MKGELQKAGKQDWHNDASKESQKDKRKMDMKGRENEWGTQGR